MSKIATAKAFAGLGWEILKWGARLVAAELRDPPEPKATPMRHVDAELQAKAARCAGHEEEPQCRSWPGQAGLGSAGRGGAGQGSGGGGKKYRPIN